MVEDIDVNNRTCKVCLAEFGETVIPISQYMPGWFLRKNAEFTAKYYKNQLFDIQPLLYSSLTNDEVLKLLATEMKV